MSEEIKNDVQQAPTIKYLQCNPVTKSHFRSTNQVTEKRSANGVKKRSANGVTGDVILLVPTDISTTGSIRYRIGICDITTAWSAQVSDNRLVIFTSKNIAAIEAKYTFTIKEESINLVNTAKETTEEETTKIKLEFLQALIENDVCIPKNNFDHGETKERAPNNDVSASTDSSGTTAADILPGRPATV